MATKGPSMRYGNTNGAHNRGRENKNINYSRAKDFNRGGLKRHFIKHGKEFGAKTMQEYAAHHPDHGACRSIDFQKRSPYPPPAPQLQDKVCSPPALSNRRSSAAIKKRNRHLQPVPVLRPGRF